jgi:rhodanese-related sulfurtransferase
LLAAVLLLSKEGSIKMLIIITILSVVILLGLLTLRGYVPVLGLNNSKWSELNKDSISIIDLRDYNDSYKNPISTAINLPIAYLNRYYKDIPNGELHVIVANHFEKNIGIRFLRKKGFRVVGYSIVDHELEANYLSDNEMRGKHGIQ